MSRSTPTTAFDGVILILCGYNVDIFNICTKEFIIFVGTDSTGIFFSKLTSAGLNYNLPSFFTCSYCAGGGGYCLLTFFILLTYCIFQLLKLYLLTVFASNVSISYCIFQYIVQTSVHPFLVM